MSGATTEGRAMRDDERPAIPRRGALHRRDPRRRVASAPGNAITTPIFQTATYVFRDTAELSRT
jgi:hypothetical protein